MSEYWKSNNKKYCDFCKCWIQDNKISVNIHEQGKKHKDNVQAKLSDIKKKTIQKQNDEKASKASLVAIEKAAQEAMKTDIANSPNLIRAYGIKKDQTMETPTYSIKIGTIKNDTNSKRLRDKLHNNIEEKRESRQNVGDIKNYNWQPTEINNATKNETLKQDLQLPVFKKQKIDMTEDTEKNFDDHSHENHTKIDLETKEKSLSEESYVSCQLPVFKKRCKDNKQSRSRLDD